jgi:hypothetical protein
MSSIVNARQNLKAFFKLKNGGADVDTTYLLHPASKLA